MKKFKAILDGEDYVVRLEDVYENEFRFCIDSVRNGQVSYVCYAKLKKDGNWSKVLKLDKAIRCVEYGLTKEYSSVEPDNSPLRGAILYWLNENRSRLVSIGKVTA